MGDITELTGMIISAMPVGEFDRRVVIITKERGKISAFAKGARRPNSPLMGITRAFVFGTFEVYEGRTSYNIRQANITQYFEGVITELDAVCYACYFAEIADYYTRENADASEAINLLYASLSALIKPSLPDELIRYVYELRMIAINGECPDFFTCHHCGKEEEIDTYAAMDSGVYCADCHQLAKDGVRLSKSAVYTIQYILTAPIGKLFTFTVSDEVLAELRMVMNRLCIRTFDKVMKSKEMLP